MAKHKANHGQNIKSYHVINVLCHLTAVVLLYKLFRRLEIKELLAFILTLVFAVHPAISQAVAWIPARNETILASFTFSLLLFAIDFINSGNLKALLLSTLFLLFAFFSKEIIL